MGCIPHSILVLVESLVVVPEIAVPVIALGRSGTGHGHLGQVALEGVAPEDIAGPVVEELHADAVVGDQIVVDADRGIGLERRDVQVQAIGAVEDLVVLDVYIGGLLEPDADPGSPGGVGDQVVAHLHPVAVHDEDAHRVVPEAVAFHQVVLGVHEMQRIAAAGGRVAADDVVPRVPHHGVARIGDLVLLHAVVEAVPEPNGVAPHTQVEILGTDPVAPDHVAFRLLQVDAEQAVVDHVVLHDVEVSAHLDTRIEVVVGVARVHQAQPLHLCPVSVEQDDCALPAIVDGHLAAAIDGHGLVHHHRAGIDAGRRRQHAAGFRGIHQGLQGRVFRRGRTFFFGTGYAQRHCQEQRQEQKPSAKCRHGIVLRP